MAEFYNLDAASSLHLLVDTGIEPEIYLAQYNSQVDFESTDE